MLLTKYGITAKVRLGSVYKKRASSDSPASPLYRAVAAYASFSLKILRGQDGPLAEIPVSQAEVSGSGRPHLLI